MVSTVQYGPYQVLGRLNAGGMAEVFLVKGTEGKLRNKLLALKRILPHVSDVPAFVSMFLDEARILSNLNHPNICAIHDQGKLDKQLYMVMDFVHGKDLHIIRRQSAAQDKPFGLPLCLFTIAKIAEALHHAHERRTPEGRFAGIVHRDVCPNNILVSYDGVPSLIDFGVAHARERLSEETKSGAVKGKTAYMSPEQVLGRSVDRRSDVFSLGVVLYELLANQAPFAGASEYLVLRNIADGRFKPLHKIRSPLGRLPRAVCGIVHRALEKHPDKRYQTTEALAQDLLAILNEQQDTRDLQERAAQHLRAVFNEAYQHELERISRFMEAPPPAQPTQEFEGYQAAFDTAGASLAPTKIDQKPLGDLSSNAGHIPSAAIQEVQQQAQAGLTEHSLQQISAPPEAPIEAPQVFVTEDLHQLAPDYRGDLPSPDTPTAENAVDPLPELDTPKPKAKHWVAIIAAIITFALAFFALTCF